MSNSILAGTNIFIAFASSTGLIGHMKYPAIPVLLLLLLFSANTGYSNTFCISGGLGTSSLGGGHPPRFTTGPAFRLGATAFISDRWRVGLDLGYYELHDDSTSSSIWKFGSDKINRTRTRKAYDISLLFKYQLYSIGNKVNILSGLGGGVTAWKMVDPSSGRTIIRVGERNDSLEVSVSELMLCSSLGLEFVISKKWHLTADFKASYMTGAGLEFEKSFKDSLSDWNYKAGITLSYSIGTREPKSDFERREEEWSRDQEPSPSQNRIKQTQKKTPAVRLTPEGKPDKDSDKDGIPDNVDQCPGTNSAAIGYVDVYGCPVDSDSDGLPDFRDNCPHNQEGALVDSRGCPLDGDKDGVPDGLDDCPESDPGFPVDRFGCIDLKILEKPMVLYIKYDPGSFEIDRQSKAKLDELTRLLLKAPGIRAEILGYTDNIGLPENNLALSQKRANRVRDYLVSVGINTERLNAVGKGESNFIASNQTREGRQKNRRVVLRFYK